MNDAVKRICGALNRQGQPCKVAPMLGKERCRLHGGKTPKGKHNGPMTHGVYSKALTDTETAQWDTVPTGDVDAEIRMCKIWLARALELDHAISRDPTSQANRAGMTLSEIRQSSGDDGMARTDSITRRPDTIVRINMLLGRIAQLEKTRSELISVAKESDEGEAKPMPWVD